MTPILVRPVREQLEHDRVIRLLQARWRRKYSVAANVGAEQAASVTSGDATVYPDLVLSGLTGSRKAEVVVEVETAESVNNLEAMAEWVRFGRLRAAFHLYVPTGSVDAAKRLCTEHGIPVAEICTYHLLGDQMRFVTVFKAPPAHRPASRPRGASQVPRRRTASSGSRPAAPARRRPAAASGKKAAAGRTQKRKS
ncbi:MAG: hypothetical protein H6Q10_2038 [Acidobacteria bacterium]|nr:hypothetical protein [Acidobacteriota bacterium]